jgi:hypothetical protein
MRKIYRISDGVGRSFSFLSWGTLDSDYSAQAQDIDAFYSSIRRVVVFVAAGNSGEWVPSTISSPAGAKNVITIGADSGTPRILSNDNCPSVQNLDPLQAFPVRVPPVMVD